MHDRQPTPGQEGRMLIIPENGAPSYYARVQMADNPLNEGTPLNTATLLKQQTASLFGLPESAVPDDVYAWLGKYAQHWWMRKDVVSFAVDYVYSSLRNAYPDSGNSDGFEWEYLGVPFDNSVTAPKIATGSYVGTGTKGESGKNSITFDGVPKFLCVLTQHASLTEWFVLWNGGTYAPSTIDNGANYNVFELTGNTLSWYAAGANITAQTQCNDSGVTYTYFAILKEG